MSVEAALRLLQEEAYARAAKCVTSCPYDVAKVLVLNDLREHLQISEALNSHLMSSLSNGASVEDALASRPGSRPATAGAGRTNAAQPGARTLERKNSKRPKAPSPSAPVVAPGGFIPTPGINAAHMEKASVLPPGAVPTPVLPKTAGEQLLGYKVLRDWPEYGGWYPGVITDYKPDTGEHVITYEFMTNTEQFEDWDMPGSSDSFCIILPEKYDLVKLAKKSKSVALTSSTALAAKSPSPYQGPKKKAKT